ncbi:hypothetical protein EMWEY_00056230 [Eimeria maxima]|uniref:Uncharacterized protein n=1 Tax=Eimeria maxima TaxID=5804 RepID=U6M4Q9_EIMMA|nr:hypothetical protein EMWEY_00056230 [Eimeria maxima]CDJ59212.1 hypothetical protein EMWEY_00056230 [Eimeria maxima]
MLSGNPDERTASYLPTWSAKQPNDALSARQTRVGLVAALMRDPKNPDDLGEILASGSSQASDANCFLVAPPPPPVKLYRKLTGPLIVSPFLEIPDTPGSFGLSIFSDLPLQTVAALDSDSHQTLVGHWDAETAGGCQNFPMQLTSPHREAANQG